MSGAGDTSGRRGDGCSDGLHIGRTFLVGSGLANVPLEDQAITESMGPIYDRSHEHLGTSDAMVIRTRRRLLGATKALQDEGTIPPGVDNPELYRIRGGGIILPRTADWQEATQPLREPAVEPGVKIMQA